MNGSSLLAIGLLGLGVVLVIGGAETFVDGLLATARRYRVSAFVVTVVLSGFEIENIAAGLAANAKGLPGAAAGTFLGGTTFLALAVAGLGALAAPIRIGLPRAALAWTAVAPLPILALAIDGRLSRRDGALLLAWFVVAIVGLARSGRSLPEPESSPPSRYPLVRLLGGLALLSIGGNLLGEGIRQVVSRIGVSQSLLGNTALIAAVEAEEIGRVAVPARRGRGDLGLGNVVGTIVHFIAFNAGLLALVRPLPLDDTTLRLHLPVAVLSPAVLCLLVGMRGGLRRVDGAFLVVVYAAYVTVAVVLSV